MGRTGGVAFRQAPGGKCQNIPAVGRERKPSPKPILGGNPDGRAPGVGVGFRATLQKPLAPSAGHGFRAA